MKRSLFNRKREQGPRRTREVPPFRSDRRAASRRRFRRFALVRHNCFRPSSRLRQHDIVSFRYFRFQAHRSMSALPPPRSRGPAPPSPFSFFSLFERFTLRASGFFNADAARRSVVAFQLNRARARALAAFGPLRTRLTRMPGRTFNLGHGAVRESDRSLSARRPLRNRGKERRPGGGRERTRTNRRGKLDY